VVNGAPVAYGDLNAGLRARSREIAGHHVFSRLIDQLRDLTA
jgi:hypothetical protein